MNQSELLTVRLLQRAIQSANPGDQVLKDFSIAVVPKILIQLAGCTAKGGTWVERKRQEMKAAGTLMKSDRALEDQSITAHLLNGLFPVATIIKRLRQIDTSVARYLDERSYRLFVAGYVLHDWEKFPGVESVVKQRSGTGFKPDFLKQRELVEPILKEWMKQLGINKFLEGGGLIPEDQVDTLAYLAHNTQEKYETHRPTVGFKLAISDRVCELTARLTRLADLFSSRVKYPADVLRENLRHLIYQLSGGEYHFTFHSISENRGVLTNVMNNALLDLYCSAGNQPLLYFPNGVAYLATKDSPSVDVSPVPDRVIDKIRSLCARQIESRLIGLQRARNGIGIKFAEYYWLFFSPEQLVLKIAPKAALQKIKLSREGAAAPRRATKLKEIQSKVEDLKAINFDFPDDLRIDQLAEFCDLIERKIWAGFCERYFPGGVERLELVATILEFLKVGDLRDTFELLKTKPEAVRAAGGVPLGWYHVSAEYLKRNLGLGPDDLAGLLDELSQLIAPKISLCLEGATIQDSWNDLRAHVTAVVGTESMRESSQDQTLEQLAGELDRYRAFKRSRSGVRPCSLCSTRFRTLEQEEAGVLFQPQLYTNKHIVYGNPKRNICPICSLEMMLRQILMNRTVQSGANFEGAQYRYLYLYPTYYFTSETVTFLRSAYINFYRPNFRTDIRDHLVNWKTGKVDLSITNFQGLDFLLISEDSTPETDRVFKLDYPNDQPITFFFAAIAPGRDATDTESWVMPAFLSLLFPIFFETKVVVSDSAIPVYRSGAEFEETVAFDAPHNFALHLLGGSRNGHGGARLRLRLDEIPYILSRFTAAYLIHLDANSRQSGNGYDPNWGQLAGLARDLSETPLSVFHYLNVWLRKQDGLDSPPGNKIRLYGELYKLIDPKEEAMNHPRRLVELYRRFYRAKRASAKANAILKPLEVAADVLLKGDRDLFGEALVDMSAAAIMSLMQRVHNRQAEGRPTLTLVEGKWKPALPPEEERQAVRIFAEYFVKQVFEESLRGDRARLTGIQLNLLRDTCEFIYRQMEDEERRKRGVEIPEEVDQSSESATA